MRTTALTMMLTMPFPDRLVELRKAKLLSQQKLADDVGISLSIVRRYEAGQAQPTLDVIRRLAITLSVTADVLVFDTDERQPADNLRMHFEALSRLDAEAQQTVLNVIDGLMLKDQAQQWGMRRPLGAKPSDAAGKTVDLAATSLPKKSPQRATARKREAAATRR